MSTVVDASVPAEEFALAQSLRENPDATFQICRVVANTNDGVMPFLWGTGADLEDLRRSLERDPTTQNTAVVSSFDGEYLFEMEWTATVRMLFDVFLNEDSSALLDAHTDGEQWHFRLVFPSRTCLHTVCEECDELGVSLDVDRAYPLSESLPRDQFQLTEKQYETVLTAYEEGYYDVPRKINLKELARRLDVSHQALSERLRRGHETLIANGLGVGPDRAVIPDAGPDSQKHEPPMARLESN